MFSTNKTPSPAAAQNLNAFPCKGLAGHTPTDATIASIEMQVHQAKLDGKVELVAKEFLEPPMGLTPFEALEWKEAQQDFMDAQLADHWARVPQAGRWKDSTACIRH